MTVALQLAEEALEREEAEAQQALEDAKREEVEAKVAADKARKEMREAEAAEKKAQRERDEALAAQEAATKAKEQASKTQQKQNTVLLAADKFLKGPLAKVRKEHTEAVDSLKHHSSVDNDKSELSTSFAHLSSSQFEEQVVDVLAE